MSEHYDSLETRSPEEREQAQFDALRRQIDHVKQNTTAYADLLSDIDARDIVDAASFSQLPLTRKSELIELQKNQRPFGGYTANNAPHYSHVFASPGPIYEPGFTRLHGFDFGFVIVNANHIVADMCQTHPSHQANVTGSNYTYLHRQSPSSHAAGNE